MKNLKKLGKVLSTKEQKNVNGGKPGSEGFCGPTLCEVCGYFQPHQMRCGNLCQSWNQPC